MTRRADLPQRRRGTSPTGRGDALQGFVPKGIELEASTRLSTARLSTARLGLFGALLTRRVGIFKRAARCRARVASHPACRPASPGGRRGWAGSSAGRLRHVVSAYDFVQPLGVEAVKDLATPSGRSVGLFLFWCSSIRRRMSSSVCTASTM